MNRDPNFDFYSFNFPKDEPTTPAPDEKAAPTKQQPQSDTPLPLRPKTLPDPAAVQAARHAYSRVGWAFFTMIIVWYASATVLELLAAAFFPALLEIPWMSILTGTLPLYVLGIPALLLCLAGMPRTLPQRQPFGIGAFFVTLTVAIAAMLVGNVIGNTVMANLSMLTGYNFSNMLEQTFDLPLWCSVLLTAVLAPVFEELIFRKLLLDRLLPFGEWMAIFVSALLFGAMHGNFYQFFYAVLVGLVLGYLAVRSGNWWLCALMHMIINLLGGVLPTLILELLDYDALLALLDAFTAASPEAVTTATEALMTFVEQNLGGLLLLVLYELAFYGAAVAGVILLIVHRRKIHFDHRPQQLPRGYRVAPALLNSGVIAALGLCAVLFVLTLLVTAVPL